MNYRQARKLSDGSGWHMTIKNDDRIWPHACCREPGPPATQEDVEKYGYKLGEPTVGRAHAPHASEEEAVECFLGWARREVEKSVAFDDALFPDWHGCLAAVASDEIDDATAGAIAACPTPEYHDTHRYCPSCPWTESIGETKCDQPTKGGARYRTDHWPDAVALCTEHRQVEVVVEHAMKRVGTQAAYS